MPGLAAVSLAIVVVLVLIARPTHELPPPPQMAVQPLAPVVGTTAVIETPAVGEPTPRPQARVAPARETVHRERPVRRTAIVTPARLAWSDPSTLPRVSMRVARGAAPYRSLAPREIAQSP